MTAHPLGKMLTAYEQKHDLSGRKLAEEIGLNKSTYCRIKQGKQPDAENLARIIIWMIGAPQESNDG